MSYSSVEVSEFSGNLIEYFKVGPISGSTYRYNTSARNITLSTGDASIDGTYTATPISLSEPEIARDSRSLRVNLVVPRNNSVAQLFRSAPPDLTIPVVVYRKHQSDSEVIAWWQGRIISCEFRESEALMLCEPTLGAMARKGITYRFQPPCNLQVYSTRCGVNKNSFKSTVTVSAVSALVVTVTGMPAVADGYYNGGYMETSDGTKRFIISHTGANLTLMLAYDSLPISSSVSIYAGDDHSHTTCRTKFNNIGNHFGFFTTPGRNIFTQGGLSRQGGAELVNISGTRAG